MSYYYDEDDGHNRRATFWRVVGVLVVAVVVAVLLTFQSGRLLTWARQVVAMTGIENALVLSGAPSARAGSAIAAAGGVETIGAWSLNCAGAASAPCAMSQSLHQVGTPPQDATLVIERTAAGVFAVWTMPTGIMVNRGMTLDIGDGNPKIVPYESCDAATCEIRAKLAPDFIIILKAATRLSATITFKGGTSFTFAFGLDGFVNALARVTAQPS
ncbi:invasion associated locus B family protein [Kaistia dalseonensis]|uniref:Invasion protein IalB n=1 Tax=Kaistia dalseonensis TaxID=410840 RepID=A0ABU0HC59_9HYPH|nr:invasion associated locus B family protein [Kaistia dalseonensis]MCX5497260.1 invasion associated locus B family protein [Kaistia dalseonensis]MDQ0439896.1 invasion protein IalB [Kaistia dalseonensis]